MNLKRIKRYAQNGFGIAVIIVLVLMVVLLIYSMPVIWENAQSHPPQTQTRHTCDSANGVGWWYPGNVFADPVRMTNEEYQQVCEK